MITGSLLNHRRRRNSSASDTARDYFAVDGIVGALQRGWSPPGPEGLHVDQENLRATCVIGPKEVCLESSVVPPESESITMVGLTSSTSKMAPVGAKITPPTNDELCTILEKLTLDDATLKKIMGLMNAEMEKGLHPDTQEEADIKMFPTYVRSIPDGSEAGDFLALDLGGTNFRVLWVHIPPGKPECHATGQNGSSNGVPPLARGDIKMKSRIFVIPPHIMTGPGEKLFDHIVKSLAIFMDKEGLLGHSLPLGFTFSFPLRQEGLDKGRLVTWTKGFSCDGVVGQDVVQMFHDAIRRYNITESAKVGLEKVKCVAIVNDTTGTLMACAHKNPHCLVGLIFGTGTNACYVEKLENVHTWDGDLDDPDEVLINTEWGAFGNGGGLDFIVTDFDRDIDNNSVNSGKQIFEKMISGMYMGEIARLVLCRLYNLGILFQTSSISSKWETPDANGSPESPKNGSTVPEILEWDNRGSFFTKYISEIESDRSNDFHVTKQVLDECGIQDVSVTDCAIVKRICETVSTRAAYLASAAIAVLLNRMKRPFVTIGIDGSLYRFHPQFHNLMMKKIPDLIPASYSFDMMLSEDGSGKGAALIAAVAQRMMRA